MDMKLFLVFVILNIANVIIQTVKSLATVKCGKILAALTNAIAYGLYTVVIVYTVCDLPLATKAVVVALANLVGVYVVKYLEEKMRKDKLWKVEATFSTNDDLLNALETIHIPHSIIDATTHYIVNFYCATQEQSRAVKGFIDIYDGKYFVSESKTL